MRTINTPTGAARTSEVALVYREVITNGTGSVEIAKHAAVRIRATAALTVSIDAVLAVSMAANEVILLNVGNGNTSDAKDTVTLTIAGGAAYVQEGLEV